jgi:hypothetical protein
MKKLVPLVAVSLALGFAGLASANDDKAVDDAIRTFKKDYAAASKDDSGRQSAIEALASTQSKKVVEALASPLAKDSSMAVRRAAAKAIGQQWSPNAVTTLVKAFNPDDPAQKDLSNAIILALGDTDSDAAVPVLTSLLTPVRKMRSNTPAPAADPDAAPVLTAPALAALKKIASPKAMDDMIAFLARESAGNRSGGKRGGGGGQSSDPLTKEAEGVLEAITGQHMKATDWRQWWADNQATIKQFSVYRCESTGKSWDKVTPTTKCPQDGEDHPHCGYALKTRLEGGGISGTTKPASSTNHKKKSADPPAGN